MKQGYKYLDFTSQSRFLSKYFSIINKRQWQNRQSIGSAHNDQPHVLTLAILANNARNPLHPLINWFTCAEGAEFNSNTMPTVSVELPTHGRKKDLRLIKEFGQVPNKYMHPKKSIRKWELIPIFELHLILRHLIIFSFKFSMERI